MAEKVLITGGAGFIGHQTANKLAGEGYTVRVFDNLSKQVHPVPRESLARLDPAVEFICGDIRDRSQLQDALEGMDAVYHFAAETGVGQSMYEIERYSDVNIQGTAVLCDCIAKGRNRPKKLILASSRAVYGEGRYKCESCGDVYPKPRTQAQLGAGNWDSQCPNCSAAITPVPTQETTPCQPLSIYSVTKEVQEDLFKMVSGAYRVPVVILRYFNVFGAGQSVSNPYTGVLSIFASRLLANKSIEIYEDGLMQRDFVPIHEVIKANAKVLELDVPEVDVLIRNRIFGAHYRKCQEIGLSYGARDTGESERPAVTNGRCRGNVVIVENARRCIEIVCTPCRRFPCTPIAGGGIGFRFRAVVVDTGGITGGG